MLLKVEAGDLPDALYREFLGTTRIAWDTETSGLDPKRDQLQLCQLYAPKVGVVAVQIRGGIPGRLVSLLSNPGIEKVFHHAPFDLRFMSLHWNVSAKSVKCTKVASKILAPTEPAFTHSLKSLLTQHLGVGIEKGAVRTSDWGARELTPDQLRYAASDVLHLSDLLEVLEGKLAERGRLDLFRQCCGFLPARVELELGDYPDVFAY